MGLNHIAIIMDGNRRWARLNNQKQASGHEKGAEALMNFCKAFTKYKIPWLTVYAFSTENNYRTPDEKDQLFTMLEKYLVEDIHSLTKQNIRVRFIGDFSIFKKSIQHKIIQIHDIVMDNAYYTLTIALNYGGRQEICYAVNNLLVKHSGNASEDDIVNNLYTKLPDVDLLIRTGGAQRLSNFLIWQATYAELYFTQCLWPDFNEKEFENSLAFFDVQKRNFGS